jgi:hypothetical protein
MVTFKNTLLRMWPIRISHPKHSLSISFVSSLLSLKYPYHLAGVTTISPLIAIEKSLVKHLTLEGPIALMHGTVSWQLVEECELNIMRGTAVCAPSPQILILD